MSSSLNMHKCMNVRWSDADMDGSILKPEHFVTINVSGAKYETLRTTLDRYPNTLLGNPTTRIKYFIPKKNAYFINRCRQSFEAVLYFYQTGGILTRPVSVPMHVFEKEVEFYQLDRQGTLFWCFLLQRLLVSYSVFLLVSQLVSLNRVTH